MVDSFFTIVPRDGNYVFNNDHAISLRVIMEDGVEVEPHIKFNEIILSGNNKVFTNSSGSQDSFSITVMFHRDDTIGWVFDIDNSELNEKLWPELYNNFIIDRYGQQYIPLKYVFDWWIRNGVPFYVHTNAVDIPDGKLWLVTENKKRKQTYDDGYSLWDLTFTQYKEINLGKFKSESEGVTNALNTYKNRNKAKEEAKIKEKEKLKKALSKCDRKVLKYEKKKKVVKCVKTLQERLWVAGSFLKGVKKSEAIDGWFYKTTKQAVINWQKKWGKPYGLKTDGKIDQKTFDALCGKGKKVTKTTTTAKQDTTIKVTQTDTGVSLNNSQITIKPSITVKAKDMKDFDAVVNASKNNVVVIDTSKKNLKTTTTTVKKNGTTVKKSSGKSTKATSKTSKNKKDSKSNKKSK